MSDIGPTLLLGDCLEKLRSLSENSVDALVTDPPAGISFMGKGWDSDKGGRDHWIAWLESVARECLRVMKPGAHGLVWALPRTSHWTAFALENAGFEIRDCAVHLFGTGFPKSLNVSKAIDDAAGAAREGGPMKRGGERLAALKDGKRDGAGTWGDEAGRNAFTSLPTTDEAKQWDGWGTALKPAAEHWILVRKPLSEKTVAANVLKWGTGALNIDGCRIGSDGGTRRDGKANRPNDSGWENMRGHAVAEINGGRWPANVLLSHSLWCTDSECVDDCAVRVLDEQSGQSKSVRTVMAPDPPNDGRGTWQMRPRAASQERGHNDSGGASRFFYVAKPSTREKNAGCDDLEQKRTFSMNAGGRDAKGPDGEWDPLTARWISLPKANHHPTVKPLALMRYLCRLVTPPGGTVLDPFLGSGTTGMAAVLEGFWFIGIEQEGDYLAIAAARIAAV